MTMSWHMMVEFEPPLVACVVSNSNHSFTALRATKECVIAIPAVELAPKVVGSERSSGSARHNIVREARSYLCSRLCCLRIPGQLNNAFLALASFAIFLTLLR
jgi:flavin reductase (DIM6/NTAB) family NADH-FMN oxidoreductase RutF